MSDQKISEVTSHIIANAYRYFPELNSDDLQVMHDATNERPIATLLHYRVTDGKTEQSILAKIHYLVNSDNPKSERPRRFYVDPDEKYELYANVLRQIEGLFRQKNDRHFWFIRLLDTIPESRTLIMTKVQGTDLRLPFLKQNRLHSIVNQDDLLPLFINIGAWLASFHGLEPTEYVEVRGCEEGNLLDDLEQMTGYLSQLDGMEAYFSRIRNVLGPYASEIAGEDVPLGRMHGDFALRNILIDVDERITVIDTIGKWQTPIYEDIAYFMTRLWTNQLQVFTMGFAYSSEWIRACEQAFLEGYFGDQAIPIKAITFYKIISLLDQWVSLTEVLKFKSNKVIHKIRFLLTIHYYTKLLNKYIEQLERRRTIHE